MSTGIMCGWELGDSSEAVATSGTFSVQSSITRGSWSTYALRVNPTTSAVGLFRLSGVTTAGQPNNSSFSAATYYVRVYIRIDTLPGSASEEIIRINDTTGSAKFYLRITSVGQLAAYDATPTLITTGNISLSTGTWYRLEIKVGSSAGATVEWKIDGATDVSTTATLSATNYGGITCGKSTNRNSQTIDVYYDDLLVSDSAYPGSGRCALLVPSANGNYQTWTIGAGTGSHYQVVDEVPPNTSDYLTSTLVSGDAETEAIADSSTKNISGTITCVKHVMEAIRDGASNGSILARLRSATTNSDAAAYTTTSSYALIGKYFDTDPATSAAWTTSGIDGIETGAVENSVSNASRISFTGILVDWAASHPVSKITQPRYGIFGKRYGLFSSKGTGALAGTATLTFGAGSSTLLGAGALTGSSDLVFGAGSSTLLGAGALLGSSDLVFGAGSSTLLGAGALAGSSDLVFGAGSSTLLGAGALAGTSSLIFGEGSSTLLGAGALAGSSALVFGEGSSTITGNSPIAGTADLIFGAGSSTLLGAGALAGSSDLVFGAGSSALSGAGALAGSSDLVFDGSGTLDLPSGFVAGTAAMLFGAGSSTLLGAGALTGSSALVFGAGSTNLIGYAAITGSTNMTFGEGSSTLSGSGSLAGTSALIFSAGSSTLLGAGALTGSSALIFTPTGTLESQAGSISGTSGLLFGAGSSTLQGDGALAGTSAIVFSLSAILATPFEPVIIDIDASPSTWVIDASPAPASKWSIDAS